MFPTLLDVLDNELDSKHILAQAVTIARQLFFQNDEFVNKYAKQHPDQDVATIRWLLLDTPHTVKLSSLCPSDVEFAWYNWEEDPTVLYMSSPFIYQAQSVFSNVSEPVDRQQMYLLAVLVTYLKGMTYLLHHSVHGELAKEPVSHTLELLGGKLMFRRLRGRDNRWNFQQCGIHGIQLTFDQVCQITSAQFSPPFINVIGTSTLLMTADETTCLTSSNHDDEIENVHDSKISGIICGSD